jgi:predicted esterase
MTKGIRILCLHGYRTNAKILRDQTLGLKSALGNRAEFIYLNAPFTATGPAEEIVEQFYKNDKPFYQWFDAVDIDHETYKKKYVGVEKSIEYLNEKILEYGPIDVLLGFSQGGAMTTILAAHHIHLHKIVPWKLNILVSAFQPRGVNLKHILEVIDGSPKLVKCNSIHVIGKQDFILGACERLYNHYGSLESGVQKFRFDHEEGHKFPTSALNETLYKDIASRILQLTK